MEAGEGLVQEAGPLGKHRTPPQPSALALQLEVLTEAAQLSVQVRPLFLTP